MDLNNKEYYVRIYNWLAYNNIIVRLKNVKTTMAWNDLTNRQKQLDRLIDGCGIKLDVTNTCVEEVAHAIGATSNEFGFVRQRIELRLKTAELLDKTDALISNTEKMLDQFEKDDDEWRRKGKKLGFNF